MANPKQLYINLKSAFEDQSDEYIVEMLEGITNNGDEGPRMAFELLQLKDDTTSRNLLMVAVAMNKELVIRKILDQLVLSVFREGVPKPSFWKEQDFENFLCGVDSNGDNVVQLAIKAKSNNGDNLVLATLLGHIKSQVFDAITNANTENQTVFHQAISLKYDHRTIAELFDTVKKNQQVDRMGQIIGDILCIQDSNQNNILLLAIKKDSPATKYLLEILNQISEKNFTEAVCTQCDKNGDSALALAISMHKMDYLTLLLDIILKHQSWNRTFTPNILDSILESNLIELMRRLLNVEAFKKHFIEQYVGIDATAETEIKVIEAQLTRFCKSKKFSPAMRDLMVSMLSVRPKRFLVSKQSSIGKVFAVLVINGEDDNKNNAYLLANVLRKRNIDLKILNNWTSETISDDIQKCIISENCTLLFVCIMTHGHHGYFMDPDGDLRKEEDILEHSINIREFTQRMKQILPQNTPQVFILDTCQEFLDEEETNAVVSNKVDDQDDGDLEKNMVVLITCMPEQKAWGNVFIKPLVEELEDMSQEDMYEILNNATLKANEYVKEKVAALGENNLNLIKKITKGKRNSNNLQKIYENHTAKRVKLQNDEGHHNGVIKKIEDDIARQSEREEFCRERYEEIEVQREALKRIKEDRQTNEKDIRESYKDLIENKEHYESCEEELDKNYQNQKDRKQEINFPSNLQPDMIALPTTDKSHQNPQDPDEV